MLTYHLLTELTDDGPRIAKLILPLPCRVSQADLAGAFSVYAVCHWASTGSFFGGDGPTKKRARMGYPPLGAVYPCDEAGRRRLTGSLAALELTDHPLNRRIQGAGLESVWAENAYRITQIKALPGASEAPHQPTVGLVYDRPGRDLCPALAGWETARHPDPEQPMNYVYFSPAKARGQVPLVVWLHGAGEGGRDPRVVHTANRVTALSGPEIQAKLGGAAYVLAPQSPTYWMDDGRETLGRSNESIYLAPLKRLIEDFLEAHGDIDRRRIYLGGLSNGGFMTVRMLEAYPGFFAGAMGVCTPWFPEHLTPGRVAAIARTPLWLVHCKTDTVVPPEETALPLYHALKAAGAEVHMSLFEKLVDLTGRYRDPQGCPLERMGHFVWIHAYNDHCLLDLDGSRVLKDGLPVTAWEWMGRLRLPG